MAKRHGLILTLALLGAVAAATLANAALPTALGFSAIPNTKIRSVCAAGQGFDVGGNSGCPAITSAWSGAAFDTQRNRMIVWGGGHQDYGGNELYAIDLDTQTVQRITDPGLPTGPVSPCNEALVGGTQPNARHTGDGLEYIPGIDAIFAFGGSLYCGIGDFSTEAWLFHMSTNTWQRMNATGPKPHKVPGTVMAYDPNTGLVFVYDDVFFYSYNPSTNVFTQLTTTQQPIGYHLNAEIDPARKKFMMVGYDSVATAGRVWSVDIAPGSNYALTQVATTGGNTIVSTPYPGLAYDPTADRLVAWGENSPNVIYSLNLDTKVWTATTVTGGPNPVGNGTTGRWRYSPTSNVFVLENSVDDNAVIYRASAGGGTTPDGQAPSTPTSLGAVPMSGTQVSVSWVASTDNIGVSGYRVYRCTGASCSPSQQVATPSTPGLSDTGLTPGTTYRYSVAAYDAAGNTSGAAAAVAASTPSSGGGGGGGGTSADADFAARCAGTGVVKCYAFDDAVNDFVHNVNVFPDAAGAFRAGMDGSMKASGAGSLRFDLPPPPHAGANISGSWTLQNDTLFGRTFSENSTFYIQFRQRLSPEMTSNTWNGSTWKTVIFHYNNATCAAIELTSSNYYGAPLAQMNTDCGARGMYTTLDGLQWTASPPLLQQQGDFMTCAYGATTAANCFYWKPNDWTTVYYKIHIGTWDQPNSTIEVFAAVEGTTTYKQYIKVPNMRLSCNSDPCTAAPGKQQGYNNLTFTPYMTALGANDGPAGVTAHMWIDELIISTSPIPAPQAALAPRPMPPTGVTVR